MEFDRLKKIPPYALGVVVAMMTEARKRGEDVINLGMGNPDLPTPAHIIAKVQEAADKPKNHRYSVSRGIPKLRMAICKWYQRHYGVELDWDSEAIATMGAKEGLSHLMLAITMPGDVVAVQDPTYPIHKYSGLIAGCEVRGLPALDSGTFLAALQKLATAEPLAAKPLKVVVLSYPANPTSEVVDLDFFEKVVALAKKHRFLVIHDLAYADLVFDGYRAPSILQVPGATDVAVEIYSLSKGYSMPGWRVGFVCGNREMVLALTRIKSYLDYGMFAPVQIAATVALDGPQGCVQEHCEIYRKRRYVLCEGLNKIGWSVEKPRATMFVWAKIPEAFAKMGSMEFSKLILNKGLVTVAPGVGFGDQGEGYVRFALVENENRIRQAIRGIKKAMAS